MSFTIHKGKTKQTIEEIVDTDGKILAGTACGTDLGHCVYIASRHAKCFDDIKYYRYSDEKIRNCPITVEFYKEGKKCLV